MGEALRPLPPMVTELNEDSSCQSGGKTILKELKLFPELKTLELWISRSVVKIMSDI